VLLAGCGETALQEGAREALQRDLPRDGRYDLHDVHCTRGAGTWLDERGDTRVFLCTVRVRSGGCDLWEVERGTPVRVGLRERDAGCVLPI
jgi:hypothetical protein